MYCAFSRDFYLGLVHSQNPALNERFKGSIFPLPGAYLCIPPCYRRCDAGPGMFASMLLPIMPPGSDKDGRWACCGKGGNIGHQYMVEKAIAMLRAQGHDGNRSSIVLVGDRFATDIRAGNRAGIKTCLVESGCNRVAEQSSFPTDVPSYWAPSIGHLKDAEHDAPPDDELSIGHGRARTKPPQRTPSIEQEMSSLRAPDLLRVWRLKVDRTGSGCASRLADVRDLLKLYFAKITADQRAFALRDLTIALEIIGIRNVSLRELETRIEAAPVHFAADCKTPRSCAQAPDFSRHADDPAKLSSLSPSCQDDSHGDNASLLIGMLASQFVWVMESFVDENGAYDLS